MIHVFYVHESPFGIELPSHGNALPSLCKCFTFLMYRQIHVCAWVLGVGVGELLRGVKLFGRGVSTSI